MAGVTRLGSMKTCKSIFSAFVSTPLNRTAKFGVSRHFSAAGVADGSGEDEGDGVDNNNKNDTVSIAETDVAIDPVDGLDDAKVVKSSPTSSGLGIALTPKEVVAQLDRFIVGQNDAKKAVAVALRNRWRRQKLNDFFRDEVTPKNILMVGPTGCGKTEIARRLAKLAQAPFLKVEATKFTEVGYHGRDVDTIIRDLVEVSLVLTKKQHSQKINQEVEDAVESILLDSLCGVSARPDTKLSFRNLLRNGDIDDRQVEVEVPVDGMPIMGVAGEGVESINPNQDNSGLNVINDLLSRMRVKKPRMEKRKMRVDEAKPLIKAMEMERQLSTRDLTKDAIRSVEENGIVFIDEIDKVVSADGGRSSDASAEGVQRDLLPILEGGAVSTKYGTVETDHILFIASGAFHSAKPSDLLAEFQGRLPIRVELQSLTEEQLHNVLTVPETNLVRQQIELMKTEDVDLIFSDSSVREVARIAADINRHIENIGARRLHTVMEKVLEDISFSAPDKAGQEVHVTDELVVEAMASLVKRGDLGRYVL